MVKPYGTVLSKVYQAVAVEIRQIDRCSTSFPSFAETHTRCNKIKVRSNIGINGVTVAHYFRELVNTFNQLALAKKQLPCCS